MTKISLVFTVLSLFTSQIYSTLVSGNTCQHKAVQGIVSKFRF